MTAGTHPLRRLIGYASVHRGQMLLASACSVLNKIFDLGPPVLIGAAVDVIVQRENSFLAAFGVSDVWDQLLLLSAITLVVWILESVFQYVYALLWRNLAQTIEHELRMDAYRHLQGLELAYYEERSTGGLMSVLSDDINQLERFLDIGANEILQVATTVVVIGLAFILLAPSVAWMAILPMPVVIWGSIRFQHLLMPYYAVIREQVGALNARLSNNLGGIMTIKAFTAEAYEVDQVARESAAYRQANRRAIRVSAAFVPLIRIVILVGFTATLLYGGMEAVEGRLSVGTYSVLVFLTQRLLWPLTRLGETLDQYQRGHGLDEPGHGPPRHALCDPPRHPHASRLGDARGDRDRERDLLLWRGGNGPARRLPLDPGGPDARRRGLDRIGKEHSRQAPAAPLSPGSGANHP